MKLTKALSLAIVRLNQPVITLYQFAVILDQLYETKQFRGENIQGLQRDSANSRALSSNLDTLVNEGILDPYRGFPQKSVFSVLGKSEAPASEVACSVDPFCYLSHLSAMEHHGLTNRMPSQLFVSSPGKDLWKKYSQEKMRKDLGDRLELYLSNHLPLLTKIRLERIAKTFVHRHSSIHLGAFKLIKNKPLRVSTIGRTFLDMLKNPELCGGIDHVLEVYEEYASTYLKLITDEISANGAPIDKVRAGYILEERLGLQHPAITDWASYAQRGGSRKLDPSGEYIPQFSERWCLSINVFT